MVLYIEYGGVGTVSSRALPQVSFLVLGASSIRSDTRSVSKHRGDCCCSCIGAVVYDAVLYRRTQMDVCCCMLVPSFVWHKQLTLMKTPKSVLRVLMPPHSSSKKPAVKTIATVGRILLNRLFHFFASANYLAATAQVSKVSSSKTPASAHLMFS